MNMIAIDFFSGCGGTSYGFKKSGVDVLYGIDFDISCKETYEKNLKTSKFICADIRDVDTERQFKIKTLRRRSKLLVSGCAPCQPFSKHFNGKGNDQRKTLLGIFSSKIKALKPEYIFIENVPGLQSAKGNVVFKSFLRSLDRWGYNYKFEVVDCADYGVPQHRKRLILLASNEIEVTFPNKTHGPGRRYPYKTVRDAIKKYPPLRAGVSCKKYNAHQARALSKINLTRLHHTPKNGGTRLSWPKELWLKCHMKNNNGHLDTYGRMRWDKPAPTMTCKCTSISNGRFAHPSQNRGISIREAAAIQTFPNSFKLYGGVESASKLVGNAVPVRLSYVFGKHLQELASKSK